MGLLILADDLTGALDSGVQLAKAGIKTLITYEPSYDILKKELGVQVLVIDMESAIFPRNWLIGRFMIWPLRPRAGASP